MVTTTPKPTALTADDEPLARRKLRDLVTAVPLVEIVGEAENGEAAALAIDELRPDIVFLDVEMPGLDGLGVLQRIRHQPVVIFTTAYDRYAVEAFELAAVDYLLKPFGRERFRDAVERALRTLAANDVPPSLERARATLGGTPLGRIFVRDRGSIVPLTLAAVERFEAQDDYVIAHVDGRRFALRVTLQAVEESVDPARFIRVHRSHIVNLDHVEAFEPYDANRLLVRIMILE